MLCTLYSSHTHPIRSTLPSLIIRIALPPCHNLTKPRIIICVKHLWFFFQTPHWERIQQQQQQQQPDDYSSRDYKLTPVSHADKNTPLTLKKSKLLTTYSLYASEISWHARLVSPLRPHLSIMPPWLYGGKAHLSGRRIKSDYPQDEEEEEEEE